MNVLIIEDEQYAAQRIKEIVENNVPDAVVLGIFGSIEDSVNFLQKNPSPDLLLMDIELSDGKSFDIFKEVKIKCPVVFTTAYDEFVLQAFAVHSIDYLLKPIQKDDLLKSISKFTELREIYQAGHGFTPEILLEELRRSMMKKPVPQAREYFLVKQGTRLVSIGIDEIAYFYSEGGLSMLRLVNGKTYPTDGSLEEIETQVDDIQFFRANRKYLLGRKSIDNIIIHFNGKLKVVVHPISKEDDLIVSREKAGDFKKWLGGQ